MEVLGMVVGRNTHTLLWNKALEFGSHLSLEKDQVAFCEDKIPNCQDGVQRIISLAPRYLVVAGNKEWVKAFLYCLQSEAGEESIAIRYVMRKAQKGTKEDMSKFLQNALQKGAKTVPFFAEPRNAMPVNAHQDDGQEHLWYRTAMEYMRASTEVRRAKHLVLSTISVLFPEAVRPSTRELHKVKAVPTPMPPDLWTQRMKIVLDNPDPFVLEDHSSAPMQIHILAADSVGRALPDDIRAHYKKIHAEYLQNMYAWQRVKEETMGRLQALVADHPLMAAAPDSELLAVVCGLVGWRAWPSWRELAKFAGLEVSRVDESGNPRISRVRAPLRNYLFLITTLTNWGKHIVDTKDGVPMAPTSSKVKRIEGLLGGLRRKYLCGDGA